MAKLCYLFPAIFIAAPLAQLGASQLAKRMEAKYRSARTLQAVFLERYLENGREVCSESGIAYFKRPGRMRWEYEAPEKNVFLVDGKTAWFYVPADHSVTRVPTKKSGDLRTPLALLAGEMKISRLCARLEISKNMQPQTQGNTLIYCSFPPDPSSKTQRDVKDQLSQEETTAEGAFFEVVPGTGELTRILVRESAAVEVEFRFSHWQFDPPLTDSFFHFDVPKGVAILNGELPDNGQGN